MKLSEAIRKGAQLRPQGYWTFFADGCSCSLGAAAEANGYAPVFNLREESAMVLDFLCEKYPFLVDIEAGELSEMGMTIGDLNDNHINGTPVTTREQVADWVESQGY